MASKHHIGQRLSFEHALCTVRYIGPVAGTQKEWLGVEWDDPVRGKHDGEYTGVRYFTCQSLSKTAASFIRPSRPADVAQSFVSAVHSKYVTDITDRRDALAADLNVEIIITGGKVAQEIGFDKIRKQMAQLDELKIVLVDGLRVHEAETPGKSVRQVCPKIVELDLSRNLFETVGEIVKICRDLDHLKSLTFNGNRIQVANDELISLDAYRAFSGITTLNLDNVLLSWDAVCTLTQYFTSLLTLNASSNEWTSIPRSTLVTQNLKALTSLSLDHNSISSLSDLSPLQELPSLERLYLKGNQINTITNGNTPKPLFKSQIHHVDLSYNCITTWSFVDELSDVFPYLTSLRISQNPVYMALPKPGGTAVGVDETYMLTLARLSKLKILNYSTITAADRTNAEMFYLSRIAKSMAEVPEGEEHRVTLQHPRFVELCELYGEPTVVRTSDATNADFLEARLIKFTFHLPAPEHAQRDVAVIKEQEIPKGFDIYRVKGIVGRMFGLRPMKLRLVWETGEWDPVAGYEDEDENSGDENADEAEARQNAEVTRAKGQWMRREVELEDSTRQIGFCIDGKEAKVRVELR